MGNANISKTGHNWFNPLSLVSTPFQSNTGTRKASDAGTFEKKPSYHVADKEDSCEIAQTLSPDMALFAPRDLSELKGVDPESTYGRHNALPHQNQKVCPRCGLIAHDEDDRYCEKCGSVLADVQGKNAQEAPRDDRAVRSHMNNNPIHTGAETSEGESREAEAMPRRMNRVNNPTEALEKIPAPKTIKCPSCRGTINSRDRFCGWCGHQMISNVNEM